MRKKFSLTIMNFDKLVLIFLLLIFKLAHPVKQSTTDIVTEIVYEYYEVSGDDDVAPEATGGRPPSPASAPSAPLPPIPPKSVLPPEPLVLTTKAILLPASLEPSVKTVLPPTHIIELPAKTALPSVPRANPPAPRPPSILPQVDNRNIVVQPPAQPVPPAPQGHVTHWPRKLVPPSVIAATMTVTPEPNDNQPVVFGITSLPASKFVGVEKARPAPPQPFQNNNFFGSVWAPWSAWGLCQSQSQMRVRACNTVIGFSCFGTNLERKQCIETSDDRPVLLFEPSDPVTEQARLAVENLSQEAAKPERLAQKKRGRGKNNPAGTSVAIPTAPPPPDEGTSPPADGGTAPPPPSEETAPPPPSEGTAPPPPTEALTSLETTIAITTLPVATPPLTPPITAAPTTVQTPPVLPPVTSFTQAPITQAPITSAPSAHVLTFVPFQPEGPQPPFGPQTGPSGPQVIPQIPAPIDMSNFVWNGEATFPPFKYIQIQPKPGIDTSGGDNGPAPVQVPAYGNNKQWGQQTGGFNRGSAPINDAANWNEWSPWSGCQCGRQSRTRTCDFNNAALTSGCAGSSYQIIQCGSGGCSLTGGVPLPTNDFFGSPSLPGAFAPSYQAPGYRSGGQIPASSYSSSGIYNNFPKPSGTDYGPPASPYQTGPPLTALYQANPPPPASYQAAQPPAPNPYKSGYGYANSYYPVPTSGPEFFNVWLDGVWQPTAIWKPPPPTTPRPAPMVTGYGVPDNGFQPEPTESPPTILGPEAATPLSSEPPPTLLASETTFSQAPPSLLSSETSSVEPPSALSAGTESTAATTEEEEEETTTVSAATEGSAPLPPPEKRLAKQKRPTLAPTVKKINRKPHS